MSDLMRTIFVSTSCLKQDSNSLSELVEKYRNASIDRIELGYVQGCKRFDIDRSMKELGIQFLVHNYFPQSDDRFVLNLASGDPSLLARSISLCENAIDIAAFLGAPYYSVHAGFLAAISPDTLGGKARFDHAIPYDTGYRIFVDSVGRLISYAKTKNVEILIEPNVLTKENLMEGRNTIALMCESHELIRLAHSLGSEEIGILLDTGHLGVTANTLSFDRSRFVYDMLPKIRAIHLHDNDGSYDRHEPVRPGSWVFEVLFNPRLAQVPIILEAKFDSVKAIRRHLDWLASIVDRHSGTLPNAHCT
jgi:sugar phosphate isomerase/epimerase